MNNPTPGFPPVITAQGPQPIEVCPDSFRVSKVPTEVVWDSMNLEWTEPPLEIKIQADLTEIAEKLEAEVGHITRQTIPLAMKAIAMSNQEPAAVATQVVATQDSTNLQSAVGELSLPDPDEKIAKQSIEESTVAKK